ncbi:type II toxin-antitoxin system prevent-host-death family antitoxin [Alkalibaculum sp. M08DMB]|uniref:Antitoxin n=1 Tax=Alkalibaculum sporogenes TaxID=2655001 RepID=A0A6A7KCG0_9FIRM|nr:type II toxin-antitoxin system prevent-host-death family antitoxin [Alkalibaculum sporogenes]MPW27219.1 type II toxin-antitoxin system prevent-host-death family antitoxin [Alkalibaculum sporogenes]
MSNIKPVSDLRNYNDVLKACQIESPVFLTKKGRGKYVLLDIEDFEKMKASLRLLAHLEEGEKSARVEGWFSTEDIEEALGTLDV